MDRAEKQTVAEMLGESLRETGVLIFVFLLFERLIDEKALSRPAMLITAMSFALSMTLGIWIERRR